MKGNAITKSKAKELPKFRSASSLVAFFEKNDMGPYIDQMPEVKFDVRLKKKQHVIFVESALSRQIQKLAGKRRVSSTRLVNSWLKEKLAAASKTRAKTA